MAIVAIAEEDSVWVHTVHNDVDIVDGEHPLRKNKVKCYSLFIVKKMSNKWDFVHILFIINSKIKSKKGNLYILQQILTMYGIKI